MVTGLLQTADHGFVISGSCINFSNQSDGLLLKTAPEGTDASNAFDPRPASFTLSAFPNPFNPATTISFSLPQTQAVKLVVYDVSGREVRVLSNGRYEAGEHHITFDGTELPSGIYFAHLESKDQARTTKLMLLK
jgi:pullulanase/glycogen debranching enzyme